jgi:hypothetical protein
VRLLCYRVVPWTLLLVWKLLLKRGKEYVTGHLLERDRIMRTGPEVSWGWWKGSFELRLLNGLIHDPKICVIETAARSCCSIWYCFRCVCVCVYKIRRVWNYRSTISVAQKLVSFVRRCATSSVEVRRSVKFVLRSKQWCQRPTGVLRRFCSTYLDLCQYEQWKVKLVTCIRTVFWKARGTTLVVEVLKEITSDANGDVVSVCFRRSSMCALRYLNWN